MTNKQVVRAPVFIPQKIVFETMGGELSILPDGKYNPEPLKSLAKDHGVPATILVDKNVPKGVNEAEVHRHEADLWICIDGEVHFIVGGEMVEPWAKKNPDGSINDKEIKAKEIRNGTEHTLRTGDVLYIPEGNPHVHFTEGTAAARLWIIKIPARSEVPLTSVPGWQE
ncbi:MAG: cupin domain-containing protein [bacterium]|nr:cupin domain-containing protein [bacterium]